MALKRFITVTLIGGKKFAFPADEIEVIRTADIGAEIHRRGSNLHVKESVDDIVKLANSTLPTIYAEELAK